MGLATLAGPWPMCNRPAILAVSHSDYLIKSLPYTVAPFAARSLWSTHYANSDRERPVLRHRPLAEWNDIPARFVESRRAACISNYVPVQSPNHFLVTEFLGLRGPKPRLPSRRLMDNMAFGWERPSEDEFALCLMGQPSPYRAIAFPNQPLSSQCLDLERISRRELGRWKSSFVRFLKQITYLHPKRIVLKSPPHTCRIKVLLELFPDCAFCSYRPQPV